MSQVRDAILINVYLEGRNPGGSGIWSWGYMSKGREWGVQFTSNRRPRWTDPVTARRVPSKWKGVGKGNKGRQQGETIKQGECVMCTVIYIRVYKWMLVVIEWYQLYMYIIIISGMNIIDNLNSVQVINKPCMSSRCMSLLPRTTPHSDSEQLLSLFTYVNHRMFQAAVHRPFERQLQTSCKTIKI